LEWKLVKNLIKGRSCIFWGRENGWFCHTFPDKPFHKTHVNLCKICSPMVHLQHLYLAILNFYSNLTHLNCLKTCWPNKNRRSSAPKRCSHTGRAHHAARQASYAAVPELPNREYGEDADHIIAHPKCNRIAWRDFPSAVWQTHTRRHQAPSCPVGLPVANTVSWPTWSISTHQSLRGEGWKSSSPLLPLPAYRKDLLFVIAQELFC
jgi:hypothetical protein